MPVPVEFAFTIEYAKSNRSTCRTTEEKIEKGALRIGQMVQSEKYDGRVPQWHGATAEAFFKAGNKGLVSPTMLYMWDELKPSDQNVVEQLIAGSLGGADAAASAAAAMASPIFEPTSEAKQPSKAKAKGKRGGTAAAGGAAAKRPKAAAKQAPAQKKYAKEKVAYDKELEFQWTIKDALAEKCKNKDMQLLLEANALPIKGAGYGGTNDLQRNAKDAMCFGVAQSPGEAGGCCSRGTTLSFDVAKHEYVCGKQGDWGSCLFTCKVDDAEIHDLTIPESLEEHEYLGSFEFKRRARLQKPVDPSENIEALKMQSVAAKYKAGSKAQAEALRLASSTEAGAPFADLVFCIATPSPELTEKIEQLGGVTKPSVTQNVTHLVCTESEYNETGAGKRAKMVNAAAKLDTCVVVAQEWVDRTFEAKARRDDRIYRLDLSVDQKSELEKRTGRKRSAEGESETVVKLVVKGRSAVDPDAASAAGKKLWTEKLTEEGTKLLESEGKDIEALNLRLHTVAVKHKEWEPTTLPSYLETHVLDEGGEEPLFLGNLTDVRSNMNSYYGVQLIKHDESDRWWLFRKWGRVGTDIGNMKLDEYETKELAVAAFAKAYGEKTGNDWDEVMSGEVAFAKRPNCFFPVARSLDSDGADADAGSKLATVKADSRSALDPRVQELMCLIFDVKLMEQSLKEMDIDLAKMPLGNLKKTQITAGYEVLSKIQDVLSSETLAAQAKKQQLSDLSNHFYTLIPHDFGLGRIKVIDSTDELRAKIKMIEALLDIQCAVTMLSGSAGGGGGGGGASGSDSAAAAATDDVAPASKKKQKTAPAKKMTKKQAAAAAKKQKAASAAAAAASAASAAASATAAAAAAGPLAEVDQHYAKLHCDLTPLDKDSDTFKLLESYVHAGRDPKGLASYEKFPKMSIVEVFEADRAGEAEVYAPQVALGNRKMLWHGSGTSNFGGILSQGMRIAPPEAPKTGYRFGKGAYFADVIGKSASYCRTSGSDEILIMACDVALGEEWETKKDKYMDKSQPGSHCTHALGKFVPKPDGDVDDGTGCIVPAGVVEKSSTAKSSVNVNEFIVYSTDQVRIRYLLRLKLGEDG